MIQYKITQAQFKIISELQQKFGDVSLSDLYNNSIIVDANGNKIQRTTTEEACRNLTDTQIEELLQDKITNMCIYTYYDLANHSAGFLSRLYNDEIVGFNPWCNEYTKQLKPTLESKNTKIELVASAIKTIAPEDYMQQKKAPQPKYSPKTLYTCGNIIFRDKRTGKFHAMSQWMYNYSYDKVNLASQYGLSNFMNDIVEDKNLQSKILAIINHELQNPHNLSR